MIFDLFVALEQRNIGAQFPPGKNVALIRVFNALHPSMEEELSLKIVERDQTIWKSTPEL